MTTGSNCSRCAELLALLEDNERWQREVLIDFRIPFDDHKIGRRLALTQWMRDRLEEIDRLNTQVENLQLQQRLDSL